MQNSQDDGIHPSGNAAYVMLHLSQQIGISGKTDETMIPNMYQQGLLYL